MVDLCTIVVCFVAVFVLRTTRPPFLFFLFFFVFVLFDNYCDNFSEGSGRGVPNDTRLQGDEAGRESGLGGTSGGFRESA